MPSSDIHVTIITDDTDVTDPRYFGGQCRVALICTNDNAKQEWAQATWRPGNALLFNPMDAGSAWHPTYLETGLKVQIAGCMGGAIMIRPTTTPRIEDLLILVSQEPRPITVEELAAKEFKVPTREDWSIVEEIGDRDMRGNWNSGLVVATAFYGESSVSEVVREIKEWFSRLCDEYNDPSMHRPRLNYAMSAGNMHQFIAALRDVWEDAEADQLEQLMSGSPFA